MSRRLVLTTSILTSFAALSSVAFSAAVVRTEGNFFTNPGLVAKMFRSLEAERLTLVSMRTDMMAAGVTLDSHRAGSWVTLAGLDAITQNALPMDVVDRSGFDETMFAANPADFSPAAATTAAPASENIGSASNFAAVPEPSAIGLLAMGAFAFLRRRRG